jgi:hypothetical protein
MGTQRIQMKRVLPWACRAITREFCSTLAALVGPVQNNFFLIEQYPSFVPIAQQAGQTVLGHLSLNMCLWLESQI